MEGIKDYSKTKIKSVTFAYMFYAQFKEPQNPFIEMKKSNRKKYFSVKILALKDFIPLTGNQEH